MKRFTGRAKAALADVSLSCDAGRVTAVVGPNGAGKTTLLQAIAGLLDLDSGRIELDDGRVRSVRAGDVALLLDGASGLVPRFSVAENFRYFSALARAGAPPVAGPFERDWLAAVNLADVAGAPAQTLSRGMAQRLNLALALSQGARVLLLDEPTTGLDIEEAGAMEELVRSLTADRGLITVFTSHAPDSIVSLADDIHLLSLGVLTSLSKPDGGSRQTAAQFKRRYLDAMEAGRA